MNWTSFKRRRKKGYWTGWPRTSWNWQVIQWEKKCVLLFVVSIFDFCATALSAAGGILFPVVVPAETDRDSLVCAACFPDDLAAASYFQFHFTKVRWKKSVLGRRFFCNCWLTKEGFFLTFYLVVESNECNNKQLTHSMHCRSSSRARISSQLLPIPIPSPPPTPRVTD